MWITSQKTDTAMVTDTCATVADVCRTSERTVIFPFSVNFTAIPISERGRNVPLEMMLIKTCLNFKTSIISFTSFSSSEWESKRSSLWLWLWLGLRLWLWFCWRCGYWGWRCPLCIYSTFNPFVLVLVANFQTLMLGGGTYYGEYGGYHWP